MWERYFSFGTMEYEVMAEVALCHQMHWTYEQYLEQPTWFINMLFAKLKAESNHLKKQHG